MSGIRLSGVVLAAALALLSGCKRKELTQPVRLSSGQLLEPELLGDGYEAYMMNCYACHGEKGDGNGPSSPGMRPPPRNFARGLFKFPGTAFGQLPVDSALERTIRRGLHGTPMLPWDVSLAERRAIIAYLKSLSPRWAEEEVPPELEVSADPWKGHEAEAIALGRQVYHVAQDGAGCSGCHASYVLQSELSELNRKVTGEPITEFAPEMYRTSLKETEYPTLRQLGGRVSGCEVLFAEPLEDVEELSLQLDGALLERDRERKEGWDYLPAEEALGHGRKPRIRFFGEACKRMSEGRPSLAAVRPHRALPPDFLFHRVKSAYPVGAQVHEGDRRFAAYTEQMQREDLYRTIGVGIGGAAMPGWKGVLPEEKLWALTYYVQSLIQLRDTPEGMALRKALEAQPD